MLILPIFLNVVCIDLWLLVILPIFNVRQKTDSYRLDACPSVRPSVTRWYCVVTAQPIVKLSSLSGSPVILVLCGPKCSPEFQWEHPQRGRQMQGVGKSCNFRPISRYSL